MVSALGGNAPPELSNVRVERVGFTGRQVSFTCDATDPEDGTPNVAWISDRSGLLGFGTSFQTSTLPYGRHVITVRVRDSGGWVIEQTVAFELVNAPPTVLIDAPQDGSTWYAGQTLFFQVYTFDAESGTSLPDASVVWQSNRDGQLGTGNFLQHALNVEGAHVITVTATDADGVSSQASTTVTVLPAPPDGVPPTCYIYTFDYNPYLSQPTITMTGAGQDKEDGTLTGKSLAWTIVSDECTWNIPGGVAYGTFVNAILTPNKYPAKFRITLTATDSSGKSASYSRDGSIYGPPR